MPVILAIDPGPVTSGWCVYDTDAQRLLSKDGQAANTQLLTQVREAGGAGVQHLAVEMLANQGRVVGAETFETCLWIGRFIEAWSGVHPVELVYRADVKLMLCGTTAAKDPNVRQALIDLFPATGGGSIPQIGNKKQPGPLFEMNGHIWPALGVAIACQRGFGYVGSGAGWRQLHPDVHAAAKPLKK